MTSKVAEHSSLRPRPAAVIALAHARAHLARAQERLERTIAATRRGLRSSFDPAAAARSSIREAA